MWQIFTFKIKQFQTVIQFTVQILRTITDARLDNLVFADWFIYSRKVPTTLEFRKLSLKFSSRFLCCRFITL